MDLIKLREDLEKDEGVKYEIYEDHLGYATFGIGHLITANDPEVGLPIGHPISEVRVLEAFTNDIKQVIQDCYVPFPNFDDLPEECQLVIANMMFNLGRTRFMKFKKFIQAIHDRDWETAGREMLDSRWAAQVKGRALRLHDRILALGDSF